MFELLKFKCVIVELWLQLILSAADRLFVSIINDRRSSAKHNSSPLKRPPASHQKKGKRWPSAAFLCSCLSDSRCRVDPLCTFLPAEAGGFEGLVEEDEMLQFLAELRQMLVED